MTIKVSILILTYNRLALSSVYIPHIIESAGNIPFEVLIWDNGSTDGSFDWVHTYKEADCRVYKVFGSETNLGMEAFNTLAQEARGEYIIKVDDDITVPYKFAQRLVTAYETIKESKLMFLGWDMPWGSTPKSGGSTFATRSGMRLYEKPKGKTIQLPNKERVLIHYDPKHWMMNGVCRLSLRDKFLEIGGHPKGVIYGVDKLISERAAAHGYWIGYLTSPDLVYHRGGQDTPKYRTLKDIELHKANRIVERPVNVATTP